VVKVHVRAEFHQAVCSGSRVIVVTEKKNRTETILSVATAQTVTSKVPSLVGARHSFGQRQNIGHELWPPTRLK